MYNMNYIYPKEWDQDDIIKFKYYLKETKSMYENELPEDLMILCIQRQINIEKGLAPEIEYDKIVNIDIKTPFFEEFESTETHD